MALYLVRPVRVPPPRIVPSALEDLVAAERAIPVAPVGNPLHLQVRDPLPDVLVGLAHPPLDRIGKGVGEGVGGRDQEGRCDE